LELEDPNPETLSKKLHPNVVLTPHAGEFARLFPDLDLQAPIEAVQDAAARAGCTVLLKGPVTLIAGPESTCAHLAVGKDAAPWLGTAGAGDVLAGLITGLLARGFTARKATEMAVWIHAACAREIGPGLIAEDLPDAVPSVFKRLERGS
jgi:NAD(P)H-hydrate repair Nnr-like enzyme with NAD(P)H-hydrate dehydratase domain